MAQRQVRNKQQDQDRSIPVAGKYIFHSGFLTTRFQTKSVFPVSKAANLQIVYYGRRCWNSPAVVWECLQFQDRVIERRLA
jgi:hypothetical protein